MIADPELTMHGWLVLAVAIGGLAGYMRDELPSEYVSLCIIGVLMLVFHFFPLYGPGDVLVLAPEDMLRGLANPALIAILALLIIGQAMVYTGSLDGLASALVRIASGKRRRSVLLALGSTSGLSAFLNNTPVVVIFIPIIRAIAERFRIGASRLFMPLSYVAILGGMLTLIGSSTNLLISGELAKLGQGHLSFFEMTPMGLILFVVGFAYVLALTKALPRAQGDEELNTEIVEGRQFIAEIDVVAGSRLAGLEPKAGMYPGLKDVTVRLIQRGDRVFFPPFETPLQDGDIMIVAATRKTLTTLLQKSRGQLLHARLAAAEESGERQADEGRSSLALAEVMVAPAARIVGQTLEFTNFAQRSKCTVLGIQRRARMLRARMNTIRLEAGDVLLVLGKPESIRALRNDIDVVLLEWSAKELPRMQNQMITALVFAATVIPPAFGLMPIYMSAVLGATALILTDCINLRQATRAIDRQIVLIIMAALALGQAMEATGVAAYLANSLLGLLHDQSTTLLLSVYFLIVALVTNFLSNNATGVLFTPIGINLAQAAEVDPHIFALATLFAANCSFATPIGYQTNLLVMGPGQYRFADFIQAGLPLIILIWITFTMAVPIFYSL
ncbi:MAG: SLC13 family permease [Geminicoccaceae bacterium]